MKKKSLKMTAKKYAQALFDASKEKRDLAVVFQNLNDLKNVLDDQTLLKNLDSPLFKKEQKKEIISLICQKLKLNTTTTNFLYLLTDGRCFGIFNNILQDFEELYRQDAGIVQVCVQTVMPLSETQEKKLKEGLAKKLKKEVVLSYKLNENLLGGLILDYNSIRIDDSVLRKLSAIEDLMKGAK